MDRDDPAAAPVAPVDSFGAACDERLCRWGWLVALHAAVHPTGGHATGHARRALSFVLMAPNPQEQERQEAVRAVWPAADAALVPLGAGDSA